jgi:hypothetical protein
LLAPRSKHRSASLGPTIRHNSDPERESWLWTSPSAVTARPNSYRRVPMASVAQSVRATSTFARRQLGQHFAVAGRFQVPSLCLSRLEQKRRVEGEFIPTSITKGGWLRRKQGRYGEAESLALSAYERTRKSLGPDAGATKRSVSQISSTALGGN